MAVCDDARPVNRSARQKKRKWTSISNSKFSNWYHAQVAALAVHVDDCPGVGSSDRIIDYIKAGSAV